MFGRDAHEHDAVLQAPGVLRCSGRGRHLRCRARTGPGPGPRSRAGQPCDLDRFGKTSRTGRELDPASESRLLANTERISESTVSSSSRPKCTGRVGKPGIASSLSSTRIKMGTWLRFAWDQARICFKASTKVGACRPEIDIGHVQYFQARLSELPVRVRVGAGFLAHAEQDFAGRRGREQSSLGVGVHDRARPDECPGARIALQVGGGCSRATRPGGGRWPRSAPARSCRARCGKSCGCRSPESGSNAAHRPEHAMSPGQPAAAKPEAKCDCAEITCTHATSPHENVKAVGLSTGLRL